MLPWQLTSCCVDELDGEHVPLAGSFLPAWLELLTARPLFCPCLPPSHWIFLRFPALVVWLTHCFLHPSAFLPSCLPPLSASLHNCLSCLSLSWSGVWTVRLHALQTPAKQNPPWFTSCLQQQGSEKMKVRSPQTPDPDSNTEPHTD